MQPLIFEEAGTERHQLQGAINPVTPLNDVYVVGWWGTREHPWAFGQAQGGHTGGLKAGPSVARLSTLASPPYRRRMSNEPPELPYKPPNDTSWGSWT